MKKIYLKSEYYNDFKLYVKNSSMSVDIMYFSFLTNFRVTGKVGDLTKLKLKFS